jgi:hypothetical protein
MFADGNFEDAIDNFTSAIELDKVPRQPLALALISHNLSIK